MAILTICNHKGGTGKTTSSVHLAAAFGLMGHRVLVVDLDPQGFLTRTVGADEPPPERSSLALLDSRGDLRQIEVVPLPHYDLLGSSMSMTRELRRLTRPTDVFWMRETFLQGHDYDLIVIDTAAALSVFTMNALVASDAVVIPVTPEYQPVVGAEQTWQTSGLVRSKLNPGLHVPRFLLTQVDGRLRRHARYAEYLRERYNGYVLTTPIRTSSSLAAASRDGRTVFDAKVMSRGALDYANASEEILRVLFPDLSRPAPVNGAPSLDDDDDARDDPTANPVQAPTLASEASLPTWTVSTANLPGLAPPSRPPPELSPGVDRNARHPEPTIPASLPIRPPARLSTLTEPNVTSVPSSAPAPDDIADVLAETREIVDQEPTLDPLPDPPEEPSSTRGDGDAPQTRRFRL